MRIYVAGPMTGYPELNFPAFNAETARLRALGHEVVNPAEVNPDSNAEWRDCMRADIKVMVDCDAVQLLHKWQHSKGACLEYQIATALGLAVFTPEQPHAEPATA